MIKKLMISAEIFFTDSFLIVMMNFLKVAEKVSNDQFTVTYQSS
jgi:hypothetical protein